MPTEISAKDIIRSVLNFNQTAAKESLRSIGIDVGLAFFGILIGVILMVNGILALIGGTVILVHDRRRDKHSTTISRWLELTFDIIEYLDASKVISINNKAREAEAHQSIIIESNIPTERTKEITKVIVTSENAKRLQKHMTILAKPSDLIGDAIRF